ncbi:OsmC family peroxiredoxin [Rufibacter latericius]|uniref:OsmC family peroxiredoxin n=1 Tax=Rufibacter latericius TaxID=2487040 RepID=A0A3M9N2A4_9BACT|nr:OsmC family peroxiredoxin [Rufibacter latericius]RNI31158.1 OsmC family peroxiredoxin [Rufibacter latericius]
MANNTGTGVWEGGLKDGKGTVSTQSGTLDARYSFGSRFEEDVTGTNPEELVGAAHAGCFSMFLSSLLEGAGKKATSVRTQAKVHLGQDNGPYIRKIDLTTEVEASGLSNDELQELAQKAKEGCPISRALASVPEMTLTATLKGA